MKYDPIKKTLGNFFDKTPFLRKLFYRMLDTLLLRTWHVKKEVKKWKRNFGAQQAAVLDAGSGFGQYSYYLSRAGKNWKIKGVDVKTDQVEDCNRFFSRIGKDNVHFEYTDLTRQTEPPGSYDLAISVDVMEHIEDDQGVFNNLCHYLKKGGMLLISTPSDKGGSDVHDHDQEGSSFIEEHVRDGYNIDEIQDKLKKAGFSKTEARYAYGKPGKYRGACR